MAKVDFRRVATNAEVENIDIVDGQFIVSGEGKSFVDFGNERKSIAGTPDTEMSDVSTNSVENKVVKEYIDNKSISESGSNANGNYIKYADGTMICWGSRRILDINVGTQWGSVYETTNKYDLGSFPATFISAPELFVNTRNGTTCFCEAVSPTTTALGETWFWSPVERTRVGFYISFMAIGKWK